MHFALLSDHISKGLFIQKGLKCEDLSSHILSGHEDVDIYKLFHDFDGLIIVSDNPNKYISIMEKIREHEVRFLVSLFSVQSSVQTNLFLEKYPEAIFFSDPYPFRKIGFVLRTSLYDLKDSIEKDKLLLRDITLDVQGHTVRMRDCSVYLRNKEFSLLRYFMQHQGKLLTRNTILENVWDQNTNMLTNTVDVHVSQLRKKIRKYTGEDYIKTVPCLGYVFE